MAQHRQSPPPSKPATQSGRPDLGQRLDALEKLVRESLDEKNLWNAKVREWIGHRVTINTLIPSTIEGVLLWMDRYTLCIQEKGYAFETIVHKGAIATIQRLPD